MLKIPTLKLRELIMKEGLITEADFDDLLSEASRMGQNMEEVLVSRGVITVDYWHNFICSINLYKLFNVFYYSLFWR